MSVKHGMNTNGSTGNGADFWSGDDAWINTYFQHISEEELAGNNKEELEELARAHRDLAAQRKPGQALVDVLTGENQSTLLVATDDMSFLVSSLTAEIAAQYGGISSLNHPTFIVNRDDEGKLTSLKSPGLDHPVASGDTATAALPILSVEKGSNAAIESWISIRLASHIAGAERVRLIADVQEILDDVRLADADNEAMAARVLEVAQGMDSLQDITLGGSEHYTGAYNSESDPASRVASVQEFLRWLTRGNFLFMGFKERDLTGSGDELTLSDRAGTGLGVLAGGDTNSLKLNGLSVDNARDPKPIYITKANSRSTVHRHEYLDYIGIRDFDSTGKIVGEYVILGLFSMQAYSLPASETPLVRERVAIVRRRLGFQPGSHSDKTLAGVIEGYPRSELLHTDVDTLTEIFRGIMGLEERRTTRLFLRPDDFGRFVSAVVYLPRDRYNTAVRHRIENVFYSEFELKDLDFEVRLSTSSLARIFFRLRLANPNEIPQVDTPAVEKKLQQAVRSWGEATSSAIEAAQPGDAGRATSSIWAEAVPFTYRADYSVEEAVEDIDIFESLSVDDAPAAIRVKVDAGQTRVKTYLAQPHTLTELLPVMQNMGLTVIDQRPYEIRPADGRSFLLYDFGVRFPEGIDPESVAGVYEEAISSYLQGRRESDSLDRLILAHNLSWKNVAVLRAFTHYLGQLGRGFTPEFMSDTLLAYPELTALLTEFFRVSFDPAAGFADDAAREVARADIAAKIEEGLGEIPTLDADRFMRSMATVMAATLRTNAFLPDYGLALKVAPEKIDFAPLPRPKFEIFVYSPRVEGVHLRFGSVARGGLRWSDRREDFRTEVLGLVKAQMVKNAVIIPTGAKGGFFPKQLPDPAVDRDAWLTEGREAYKIFIRSLLSVTDNLSVSPEGEETVIRREGIIARDSDDYYLVVAADKGTAAFSDTANAISEELGFWLGDAFASGGSVGYDHKAMGITARGAWESVKRHFAELGRDCQSEEFTVVGIGDMSGDVFGNGLMRTRTAKLVAAFDHRDIFLDPNPDPAASFDERVRLYNLPRSSWQDYDRSLISEGGGVYSRGAKSIDITEQVREVLGLDDAVTSLAPSELLSAILKAPVDLIYNGGIGTYIKASTETHAAVGDKANDSLRIDGRDVRARIIGEGGNLGMTQLGRIEAAEAGVILNTDAIDNSAGVETSDREVNIKILVDRLVARGLLSAEERASFIESHREDVGQQVLETNREQNVLLQAERHGVIPGVSAYTRLIRDLEENAGLVREVEFIPTDEQIQERFEKHGITLTGPELSVLAAYVKIHLTEELEKTDFADDPYLGQVLRDYFPPALVERFGEYLDSHPLRKEIICTRVANQIVDTAGITHVFRVQEETGASVDAIARAFMVSRDLFEIDKSAEAHRNLPASIPLEGWQAVIRDWQRVLDRLVRWFIAERQVVVGTPIEENINRYIQVRELRANLPQYLSEGSRARVRAQRDRAEAWGLPEDLLVAWIRSFEAFALMDVVRTARAHEVDVPVLAHIYFSVYDRFGINTLLTQVSHLPRTDRWETLARSALRDDLYEVAAALTWAVIRDESVSEVPASGEEADSILRSWVQEHPVRVNRVDTTLADIEDAAPGADGRPRLAVLSVALRALRGAVS
ncbi:NAD-glutamate dehydrogenase [Rothia aerolata]|uniref:NAD-glutamate dehydrogenase n=2 Tax=Rothia aerolata TaxID=1812262 RepID=A0A917MVF8_9MICC|nr:NAD-glutamate dehydrogenase [Rothia aerolata]